MTIDIPTDLSRRQLFGFFIFSVFAVSWIFLTINEHPDSFKFTHLTFNYEHEFVKRGLVGEILRLSGVALTYEIFIRLSRILFCVVFLSMLFVFFMPVYKNPSVTGCWLFFLMAILHPATAQHFYCDLGRFEGLELLISLLSIILISRTPKLVSYLIVPILLVLSILIHEVALFVYIPFVLGYWIYKDHSVSSPFSKLFILTLLVSCNYIVLKNGLVETRSFNEHYASLVALYGNEHVSNTAVDVLHEFKGLKENFFYTMQFFNKPTIKYHLLMFIILLPFLFIVWNVIINDIKINGYKWRLFFIGSSLCPLLLYPLAIDFYRWWALALTNLLLAIAILIEEDIEFSNLLSNTMFENRRLIFIIVVSAMLSGPLGVTFPFPRFQRPIP